MEQLERILIFLPVLLLSVVLHEVAHGWVALTQGDDTAKRAGRLTLNPVPHIDVVGSLIVPTALLLLTDGLLFGWARPVPVNPGNYRSPRRGDILVSLAGVTVNGLLAVAFTGLMVAAGWVAGASPALGPAADLAYRMGALGVILNLILAIFNLVPLPPLDGSHVVAQLLPPSARPRYRAMGRYGIGILMLAVFVAPEALSVLLWPAFALTDLAFAVVEWLV